MTALQVWVTLFAIVAGVPRVRPQDVKDNIKDLSPPQNSSVASEKVDSTSGLSGSVVNSSNSTETQTFISNSSLPTSTPGTGTESVAPSSTPATVAETPATTTLPPVVTSTSTSTPSAPSSNTTNVTAVAPEKSSSNVGPPAATQPPSSPLEREANVPNVTLVQSEDPNMRNITSPTLVSADAPAQTPSPPSRIPERPSDETPTYQTQNTDDDMEVYEAPLHRPLEIVNYDFQASVLDAFDAPEEAPLHRPLEIVHYDKAPAFRPQELDAFDEAPLFGSQEIRELDEDAGSGVVRPAHSGSAVYPDIIPLFPTEVTIVAIVQGEKNAKTRRDWEDSEDTGDTGDTGDTKLKEVSEELESVQSYFVNHHQLQDSTQNPGDAKNPKSPELGLLLYPPVSIKPMSVAKGSPASGWQAAKAAFLEAMSAPPTLASNVWPFGGSTSTTSASPSFLNEEVLDGRPHLDQVLSKSKDSTHRSDGPNYVVPHLWDNRERPKVYEVPSSLQHPQASPGQPVQKLENCGAFLSDMSTSVCRRFEKYTLRACPNDTDVCAGFAQQDLAQLLRVCSTPTQNLVCKMEYKNEPSPLCPLTVCKVYEFSIAKMSNNAPESCASQIRTLSKKLTD